MVIQLDIRFYSFHEKIIKNGYLCLFRLFFTKAVDLEMFPIFVLDDGFVV